MSDGEEAVTGDEHASDGDEDADIVEEGEIDRKTVQDILRVAGIEEKPLGEPQTYIYICKLWSRDLAEDKLKGRREKNKQEK